jgi:hypothetical protein
MFRYEIGNKTYVQKPLVLGQIQQLFEHLEGLSLPKSRNIFEIAQALGNRLPIALAIVLTEEGHSPRDKDLEKIADEIEFSIDVEMTSKAIEDFFELTPILSILERLGKTMKKAGIEIQLKRLSSSSREETSQSEPQSSGDSLRSSTPDSQNTVLGTFREAVLAFLGVKEKKATEINTARPIRKQVKSIVKAVPKT